FSNIFWLVPYTLGAFVAQCFAAISVSECVVEPVECLKRQFNAPSRGAFPLARGEFLRDAYQLVPSNRRPFGVKSSFAKGVLVVIHHQRSTLKRHAVDLAAIRAVEQHRGPESVEELFAAR